MKIPARAKALSRKGGTKNKIERKTEGKKPERMQQKKKLKRQTSRNIRKEFPGKGQRDLGVQLVRLACIPDDMVPVGNPSQRRPRKKVRSKANRSKKAKT